MLLLTIPLITALPASSSVSCREGHEFSCGDSCIPLEFQCDNVKDCSSGAVSLYGVCFVYLLFFRMKKDVTIYIIALPMISCAGMENVSALLSSAMVTRIALMEVMKLHAVNGS